MNKEHLFRNIEEIWVLLKLAEDMAYDLAPFVNIETEKDILNVNDFPDHFNRDVGFALKKFRSRVELLYEILRPLNQGFSQDCIELRAKLRGDRYA